MSLPKIAKISHDLTIPSSGKKIKFRPFLVKEEKILILAQESGVSSEIVKAMKEVISACVQTRGFKVDELATFDIEYLFLNIRGKSVGEMVEVLITCPDDGVTQVPVEIFLDEVKIVVDEEHESSFKLDDTYSIKMKYPSLEALTQAESDDISIEQSLELIASCIEVIYSDDESWSASDSSPKELISWVEDLEPRNFQKLEKFFTTMPKLTHTVEVTNPETGVKNEVVLEGLGSFFV